MKKLLILSVAALLTVSCRDYLDIQPRGQAIPRTAEDFSALLNTLLDDIDNSNSVVVGGHSNVFATECFADDIDANMMSLAGGQRISPYVGREYENGSNFVDRYSKSYSIINVCNNIIIGLASDDSALAHDVKGSAHAIRGIAYYELLRQFCEPYNADAANQLGMPIVLEPDTEAKILRSSMEDTMNQIEGDLTKAAEYDVQDPMFRFQKDVVDGFLARFYFWTEQYAKAIPLAKRILTAYPLINGEEYKEMMTTVIGKRGNILIKDAMFSNISLRLDIESQATLFSFRPVSGKLDRLFVEKANDIRYGLWYGVGRTDWRIAKKFPKACLRSAEMCLVLAECYYHENNETEALNYLNMLRNNRITDNVEFTADNLPPVRDDETIKVDAKGNPLTPLIYAILCERRKELFMEGDRWYELKRNGCPEFWIGYNGRKYVTQPFMYTSPIPYHDVRMVEGMIQNPGYDEII